MLNAIEDPDVPNDFYHRDVIAAGVDHYYVRTDVTSAYLTDDVLHTMLVELNALRGLAGQLGEVRATVNVHSQQLRGILGDLRRNQRRRGQEAAAAAAAVAVSRGLGGTGKIYYYIETFSLSCTSQIIY